MTTVIVNNMEIRELIAINKREAERLREQLEAIEARGEELEALLALRATRAAAPPGTTKRRWISKGLSIKDKKVYRSIKKDEYYLNEGWTPLEQFK